MQQDIVPTAEGGGGRAGGIDNNGAIVVDFVDEFDTAIGNDVAKGSKEPLDFSSACKFNKSAV